MFKQLISVFVGACVIFSSFPLEAAKTLNDTFDESKSVTDVFFDGSPRTRPSLAETFPVKPLLLAHHNSAIDPACRALGKGPHCVPHMNIQSPKKQAPSRPTCEERYGREACARMRTEEQVREEVEKKRFGEALGRNIKDAWNKALKLPQSEKEAIKNLAYFVPELIITALASFFIIGIPYALAAIVGLAFSLGHLAVSPIAGGFLGLYDGLTFKSFNSAQSLKDKPLFALTYSMVRLALFLSLLPISLPVVIYQHFSDPRSKIKRLKNKQESLSQERDNLQDKKEQLQMKLERLYQGEIKKPQKTREEPLPEVVKIDDIPIPPYENPAEGITEPIRWPEDLQPKPPQPSPQEELETLDKENASLNKEIKEIQDLQSEIKLLESQITEEYRQGHFLYRKDYLQSHGVTQKETERNNAITKEIKKNLGNNFWQNPQLTNSLTPETRELIKGLDLRFEVAKGPYNKNGKPLLGVLHDTTKDKSEPLPAIILDAPPFVIPSASLRIVRSPGNNMRVKGAPNHNRDTHGGIDIESDWGPKNDGFGIPVGLRHKTEVVYTYREVGAEVIKDKEGNPLKNESGKEIKVDKGFGNTTFLLDLDELKTNPDQRVFWILAHEGEYNKPVPAEDGEPRFSGILANRGETIEAYRPIILLGRSGNAMKAGKRGTPVPQVHIEKIVVTDPYEIEKLDEYIKNKKWDKLGETKLRSQDFRRPYRRDPLEGYK